MPTPYRNAMIAKIKIAQKQLDLDDATYRAMLQSVTGRNSCTKCNASQLQAVLAELRVKGWNPECTPNPNPNTKTPKRDTGPRVDHSCIPLRNKIAAILSDMECPWAYAEGILTRMYGTGASIATASRQQLSACVTALLKQQSRRAASSAHPAN